MHLVSSEPVGPYPKVGCRRPCISNLGVPTCLKSSPLLPVYFNPKSNLTGEQLVGVGGHELSDIFDQRPQGRPSVRLAFVLSLSDIPQRRSNAGCGQSDGRDLSALLPSLPFVIKAFKLAAETGRRRRLSRRQVTSQTACRLFASFFCKKKLGPL